MTACRLTFNSAAVWSSSCSMAAVKSTFTRWIGCIILPRFVKKLETSPPRCAVRAMDSAETGFFALFVCFIQLFFLLRGAPERHEMMVFAEAVFADLED